MGLIKVDKKKNKTEPKHQQLGQRGETECEREKKDRQTDIKSKWSMDSFIDPGTEMKKKNYNPSSLSDCGDDF